jgi:hypothetical protein
MRAVSKLVVLSLAAFAVAFAIRRVFFWDVAPLSWDQEPSPAGALEAAFLLLSIQNIAAVVAVLALASEFWLWIVRRRKNQAR